MLEKTVGTTVKAVEQTTLTAVRMAEGLARKAWSVLEAAVQKELPSDSLSPAAIRAVQGEEEG